MSLKIFIKIILLVYLSGYVNVFAQHNLRFENISREDGLSQGSVFAILQDSDGFMWIGTAEGLNMYDGYKFTIYKPDLFDSTTISDSWITTLFEDNEGFIWIGTFGGGLNYFNKGTNKFFHFKNNPQNTNSISDNVINSIVQDSTNLLWIGTDKGINILNKQSLHFDRINDNIEDEIFLSDDAINEIYIDRNYNIWVCTNYGGLNLFNRKENKFVFFLSDESQINSISSNTVWMMDEDKNEDSVYYIATYNGLNKFNFKELIFTSILNTSIKVVTGNEKRIRTVLVDNKNNIWEGSLDAGLDLFNTNEKKFYHYHQNLNSQNTVSNDQILCSILDASGLIWIGTRGGGIDKIITNNFYRYTHVEEYDNSLSDNVVWAIFEDEKDVWIGTGNGLDRFQIESREFKHYAFDPNNPNSINDNTIYALHKVGTYLWIGTSNGGLNRLNTKTNEVKHYLPNPKNQNSLPHIYIRTITSDNKGNIWIGTRGGGICKFNPENENFTIYQHDEANQNSLSHNRINSIFIDSKENVWIGTSGGGLNKFDPITEKFENFTFNIKNLKGLSDTYVLSITESNDGTLWFGTYNGGLNKYNPETNTFIHYTEKDGLPNNIIYGILEDDQGFLWISTNGGLSKFDPKNITFKNFGISDGVQGLEFNTGACFKGKSGYFYFGGTDGLTTFIPRNINSDNYEAPIHITDFKIDNNYIKPSKKVVLQKPIYQTDTIELSYNTKNFTIEFSALDYKSTNNILYRYILEEYDEDWTMGGNINFVKYTNVPPGRYMFKVMGTNSDGIWNDKFDQLFINIKPPFYKTIFFYILLGIVIILLFVLFVYIRERNLIYAKKVLEEKVLQRTIEISQQKEEIEAQSDEIQQQRDFVTKQKDEIEAQKQEILDSIYYAKRIQNATLPPLEIIKKNIPDHFILFQPKDIVSGDFYWIGEFNNKSIIAVADCTGHGVPGAFLSLLGISFLNKIVLEKGFIEPAQILTRLRHNITYALHQNENKDGTKDGMDISVITLDKEKRHLEFAGAINPIYIIRNNELIEIRGDRMSIGELDDNTKPFSNHSFELQENDIIYLFTDGYADQFGGNDGKKLKYSTFKEILLEVHNQPLLNQEKLLWNKLLEWKNELQQIDDILIIGIKIRN